MASRRLNGSGDTGDYHSSLIPPFLSALLYSAAMHHVCHITAPFVSCRGIMALIAINRVVHDSHSWAVFRSSSSSWHQQTLRNSGREGNKSVQLYSRLLQTAADYCRAAQTLYLLYQNSPRFANDFFGSFQVISGHFHVFGRETNKRKWKVEWKKDVKNEHPGKWN